MARVEITEYREQFSHFGLFRTNAGGDESIIVRRKVGEPTDYMHTRSRKLARQREYMTLASQHYAKLTPSQKAITRHEFEEVEYQPAHGRTETKLLTGRQLFIAKEMRSLKTTGKQIILPHEVCIMLVDQTYTPLQGELWLRSLKDGVWKDARKEQLATGSWLFSQVPRAQESYRVYGESESLLDPLDPATQFMTEDDMRATRYHILLPESAHLYNDLAGELTGMRIAFTCPISTRLIDATIEATTHEYDGLMKLGFQTMDTPFKTDEWITFKTYLLFPEVEDPKIIHRSFDLTMLTYGERYWWSLLFFPQSSIFGIFHSHLHFMPEPV